MPIALIPTLAELELVTGGQAGGRVARATIAETDCEGLERAALGAAVRGEHPEATALARSAQGCRWVRGR